MKKWLQIIVWIGFAFYLTLLMYLLFFSNYRNSVKGIVDYNLIPFRTIVSYLIQFDSFSIFMFTDNFFGNICAFIPLGLLTPLLFQTYRKYKKLIGLSLTLSMMVEISQFTTRLGSLDIDDVLLNTLGGVVGWGIWRIFFKR